MNRAERRAKKARGEADPRLAGMDVRYDGRTLVVRIRFDRPEQALDERSAFDAFAQRMKDAARGPKLRMAIVRAQALADVVEVDVYVNTDEEGADVGDRIRYALEHETSFQAECVYSVELVENQGNAQAFWEKLITTAHTQSEHDRQRAAKRS